MIAHPGAGVKGRSGVQTSTLNSSPLRFHFKGRDHIARSAHAVRRPVRQGETFNLSRQVVTHKRWSSRFGRPHTASRLREWMRHPIAFDRRIYGCLCVRKSSRKEEVTRTQKPFVATLRVNESRQLELGQRSEASLAWGGATLTAKRSTQTRFTTSWPGATAGGTLCAMISIGIGFRNKLVKPRFAALGVFTRSSSCPIRY